MNRLFVYMLNLTDANVQLVSWRYVSDKKSMKNKEAESSDIVNRGSGTFEEFTSACRENFDDVETSVVISGEHATYMNVALSVKNQRQMLQALPYLVEEQVIGNIEDMHIATPGDFTGDSIRIAIIEKIFIDKLKEQFSRHELSLDNVFTIPDLLVTMEGELHILLNENLAFVKGPNNCFQCDQDNLEMFLDLILWDGISDIVISLNEQDKNSLSLAKKIKMRFSSEEIKIKSSIFTGRLLDYLIDQGGDALNLLQGSFSSTSSTSQKMRELAPVAWVVVLCVMLQVGFNFTSGFYFSYLADMTRSDLVSRYLKLFPDEKNVVDLEAQLKNRINMVGANIKGSEFSNIFTQTINAMLVVTGKNDIHLRQFRYDEESRELKLGLDASSVTLLDKIKKSIVEKEMAVEIVSANEENGIIKATLSIKHI